MKKLLSGLLAAVVVLGVVCMPASAKQTYEIKDTYHAYYGHKELKDFVKITADSVTKTEKVDVGSLIISHNFTAPVDAYSAAGPTTLYFGEALNLAPMVFYSPTWKDLRASRYTQVDGEAVSSRALSFQLNKAGVYAVEIAFYSAPVKVNFILEVVDKASDSVLTPVVEVEAPKVKSFSDVPEGRWSHNAVMKMAEAGIFSGTTALDANGVAKFDPEAPMTHAQFVTALVKWLYGDTVASMKPGTYWYSNYYSIARINNLLLDWYFPIDKANEPITRELMALAAVRAAAKQEELSRDLVDESRIADLDKVSPQLRNPVRQAFTMGLIAGYDDKGTFGPQDTLTREQAAMIIYKLMYPEERQPIKP